MTEEVKEGLFWWRVSFYKDGSVESILKGDPASDAGRYVTYVQADDKDAALIAASVWLQGRKIVKAKADAKRYYAKIEAGLCSKCGRKQPRDGLRLCEDCAGKDAEAKARHARKEQDATDLRLCTKDPVQRHTEFKAKRAALQCNTTWLKLLATYDELGPGGFRDWLVLKVDAYRGVVQAAE